MKRTSKLIIICMVFLLLWGFYAYTSKTSEIPKRRPKISIKYNNNVVPSNMGDHNWFDMNKGGNSYMTEGSFIVGQKTSSIVANPRGTIKINFSSIPKGVEVLQWIDNNTRVKIHNVKGFEKKYELILPMEKGEYVFEVAGEWDKTHSTSNIIRININ